MSLSELKSQLTHLEPHERQELKAYLEELEADAWDAQIEADAKAGRLDPIFEEAEQEIAAGLSRPIQGSLKQAFEEHKKNFSSSSQGLT